MNRPYTNRQHFGRDSRDSSEAMTVDAMFYKDTERKRLNPDLLDKCAKQQADAFPQGISGTQLRRFFSDVKNLYIRMQRGVEWAEIEPLFRMIKSRAAYAKERDRGLIPLSDFLTNNIDKVKDRRDFEAFVMYFEAVYGFAYGKVRR